jgi:ankyrin repeat protein
MAMREAIIGGMTRSMIASVWLVLQLGGCATSVTKSAFVGNVDDVNKYLEHGSPNQGFDEGNCRLCTLLHFASSGGQVEVARVLLAKGASINATNASGRTALHFAAAAQRFEMVKFLVGSEASLTSRDKDGITPLLYAVATQKREDAWIATPRGQMIATTTTTPTPPDDRIVKILLGAGANPNVPALNGTTPLHVAAEKGYVNVVVLLLAAGANREARNAQGQTPAMLAEQHNQRTVLQMLNAPPANAAPAE